MRARREATAKSGSMQAAEAISLVLIRRANYLIHKWDEGSNRYCGAIFSLPSVDTWRVGRVKQQVSTMR